jgi:hypothetical protein
MCNQNIISNKFDLKLVTTFSSYLNVNVTYQEVPEPEPTEKCIFSSFSSKCSGIDDTKLFFPSSLTLGQNKLECSYFSA